MAAASSGPSRLRIEVVAAGGRAIPEERYLAVVPEDRPWEEPLREAVVPADAAAPPGWEIPPGRYRVVCSARGHEVAYQPAFDLVSGAERTEHCALRRLVEVSGRIVSSPVDRPFAGGKIGLPHAFLTDFSLKLSPLGESFTGPDRLGESDAEGRFRLLGLPGHKSAVWIEAEGFAPEYLPNVLFPAGGGDLGTVRLAPGGILEVTVDLPPGFPAALYSLVLRPRARASTDEVRDGLAQRIWERPVAHGLPARWMSLPVGTYDVWLKGSAQGDHQILPIELGAVDLRPERRSVKLALPPGALPVSGSAPAPAPAEGELRLISESSPRPEERFGIRRWHGDKVEEGSVTWRKASAGGLFLVAGCRPGLTLVLQSAERVSSPVVIGPEDCAKGRTLRITLHAAAELKGVMQPPTGSPRPQRARLRAALCAERPQLLGKPAGEYPFLVAADGRWSVKVPAPCLDATLLAGDFAPHTWPGVKVERGKSLDLGTQSLTWGAALLARLVSDADSLPVEGARAEVVREAELGKTVAATFSGQEAPVVAAGLTGRGGWVRLAGLPAGEFHLRVTPRDGLPTFSEHFELAPRLETLLGEVRIPPPAELSVALQPSPDLAAEFGEYQVGLEGVGPPEWLKAVRSSAKADESGVVRFPRLAPGRWRVVAFGRSSGPPQVLGKEEVQLAPGAAETLTLELSRSLYRGRVTWRGEPIEASVDLRPAALDGRQPGRTYSDAEGVFSVALDQGGEYSVIVHHLQGKAHGTIPSVVFDDPSEVVEVRLPEGRIAGSVIDSEGQSVRDASVRAEPIANRFAAPPPQQQARSREQGIYELEGLAAGEWLVSARAGEQEADAVLVELADGESRSGVKLVVPAVDRLTGRVVTAGGQPVSGARGSIEVLREESAGWPHSVSFTTQMDGQFEATAAVPPGALVNVVVEAQGYPVTSVRKPAADSLEIVLPQAGGAVELALEDTTWREVRPFGLYLVARDGSYLSLRSAGWQRRSDTAGSIPLLAAGHWVLVKVDSLAGQHMLAAGAGRGLPVLTEFEVRAGGAVRVEIPGPPRSPSGGS